MLKHMYIKPQWVSEPIDLPFDLQRSIHGQGNGQVKLQWTSNPRSRRPTGSGGLGGEATPMEDATQSKQV